VLLEVDLLTGGRMEILLLPNLENLDHVFAVLHPLLNIIGIRTHDHDAFDRARAAVRQQFHPIKPTPFPIIGDSLAFQRVYEIVLAASRDPRAHIFIEGETGTGKELIVDVLAGMGPKGKETKCLRINCAALTGATATSELFGYVEGAFTGATDDHKGMIETAGSGILFVDEVQFLDSLGRGKLLRLLQDGTYSRLGDTKERKSKARIVAATNDLKFRKNKKIRSSGFIQRFDYVISLPPLRERFGDIELLIVHFGKEFAEPLMSVDEVDPDDNAAVRKWLHRTCPYWSAWMYDAWTDSNIRGLRNAVRRWAADCQVQRLLTSDQSEVVGDPVEKMDRREPRGRPLAIPGPEILRILRKVSEDNGNIDDVFSMLVVKDKLYYQRPSSFKRRILDASDLDDKKKEKALRFIEDLGQEGG
jgi:transcriptional regulator with AAA-type ATPase domain